MEGPLLHRRDATFIHHLRHHRLGHCIQEERSTGRAALDASVDLCRDAVLGDEFTQIWRGRDGRFQVSRQILQLCRRC